MTKNYHFVRPPLMKISGSAHDKYQEGQWCRKTNRYVSSPHFEHFHYRNDKMCFGDRFLCDKAPVTIVTQRKPYCIFKVIVQNTGIFWLFRTCSASFDHLIREKTRMYFAKSLSDSIMNSYSLLPNITILIMQSTSMALQRI